MSRRVGAFIIARKQVFCQAKFPYCFRDWTRIEEARLNTGRGQEIIPRPERPAGPCRSCLEDLSDLFERQLVLPLCSMQSRPPSCAPSCREIRRHRTRSSTQRARSPHAAASLIVRIVSLAVSAIGRRTRAKSCCPTNFGQRACSAFEIQRLHDMPGAARVRRAAKHGRVADSVTINFCLWRKSGRESLSRHRCSAGCESSAAAMAFKRRHALRRRALALR